MSVEYFSIYLCLLQFLSIISYSFQCTGPSAFLVKLIPQYIILFVVIVNEVFFSFQVSLSASTLLVYRNKADFCTLIFTSCNFNSFFFFWYLWSL